jgi:drug/metabolite transporter (DMT)-like permease
MRAGWLVAFMPVTIALGAQLFRGERMRALGWLGAAVASGGVFALTATRPTEFARASTGDWLLLSSTLTWTAYTLLSIDPVKRSGPLRITAFAMAFAVVPNALASCFTVVVIGPLTPRVIVSQLFLGLLSSGVAFWAWNQAMRTHGAQRSSAVLYLQPFVTLAASLALFEDEQLGTSVAIGGPLVLLGVWLVQRSKRVER